MIKMLRHALGARRNGFGVVGRVDRSGTGKSIIEIGKPFEDDAWTKLTDGGHIALTPNERDELIDVLESHRGYVRIKVGDIVGGPLAAGVMAVEYHGGGNPEKATGTALAYSEHKREYWVWDVLPDGTLDQGTWTYDSGEALNRYQVRATNNLYRHFNTIPPKLTFRPLPDGDVLSG
jgi:hypothetical protein